MSVCKWLSRITRIGKKVRKLMKNSRKKGKSVRNGNAPSPYTKYQKAPYLYSFKSAKAKQHEIQQKRAA